MLVKGAAAPCSSWCRCRVLLQGAAVKVVRALLESAYWCHCRMPLQVLLTIFLKSSRSSQNTSSDLANVPKFRIWKFEVWFGHDSGYDSDTHFFEFRKLCCLSLFPTVNLPRLLLNGCNDTTCQTTLDRAWIWRIWRSKYTSMPPACRRAGLPACLLDVLLMYL